MKAFRFNLERVLEFHAAQLQAEEVKLRTLNNEAANLQNASASLEQSWVTEEDQVRQSTYLAGSDLKSLDSYRRQVEKQKEDLQKRLLDTRKRIAEQRERLLVARRKHRLLEKLRERRLQEWVMASNREVEQTASESHLARFVREQ